MTILNLFFYIIILTLPDDDYKLIMTFYCVCWLIPMTNWWWRKMTDLVWWPVWLVDNDGRPATLLWLRPWVIPIGHSAVDLQLFFPRHSDFRQPPVVGGVCVYSLGWLRLYLFTQPYTAPSSVCRARRTGGYCSTLYQPFNGEPGQTLCNSVVVVIVRSMRIQPCFDIPIIIDVICSVYWCADYCDCAHAGAVHFDDGIIRWRWTVVGWWRSINCWWWMTFIVPITCLLVDGCSFSDWLAIDTRKHYSTHALTPWMTVLLAGQISALRAHTPNISTTTPFHHAPCPCWPWACVRYSDHRLPMPAPYVPDGVDAPTRHYAIDLLVAVVTIRCYYYEYLTGIPNYHLWNIVAIPRPRLCSTIIYCERLRWWRTL